MKKVKLTKKFIIENVLKSIIVDMKDLRVKITKISSGIGIEIYPKLKDLEFIRLGAKKYLSN